MAAVLLPRTLTELFPAAPKRVDVDAPSVLEVIDGLDAAYPGMRERLLDAGPSIRRHLLIFVDQERAGLETAVQGGSEVRIVPALSGG
ncbi:MAG TPA: MoaD/ThiS family protein [Chloroflexota bacterium]|nr:MoaD/ThiS family protein [Chloroflexota bacterium]